MFSVSGSTSTSTGRAPTCSITFTDAVNVIGVVMTSSPGPMPSVFSAVCKAAVQELSANAAGARRKAANSPSNRFVFGPVEIQRERRVSTTSRISSSPIVGGGEGGKLLRLGGAEPAVMVVLLWARGPMSDMSCGSPAPALQTQVTCADAPVG